MITRALNLSILKRISKQVGIPLVPIIASLAAQVSFANVLPSEKKFLFVIHDNSMTKLSAIDFQISELNGGLQFSIEGSGSAFETQIAESGLEKFLTQKDYIPSAASTADYEVAIKGYVPKELRPSFNLAQNSGPSGGGPSPSGGRRSTDLPALEQGTLRSINDTLILFQFHIKVPTMEVQERPQSSKRNGRG